MATKEMLTEIVNEMVEGGLRFGIHNNIKDFEISHFTKVDNDDVLCICDYFYTQDREHFGSKSLLIKNSTIKHKIRNANLDKLI
jgi:hypothetical protein